MYTPSMKNDDQRTRNAVAYLRISDKKQIEGESPVTQRTAIEKYADENNINIVEWFYDEAKSGKNTDREELQNLIKYATKNSRKIDLMLVYKLNRGSRDASSYYSGLKMILEALEIGIRSASEPMVDDTAIGRFLEGMIVLNAQLDNEVKGSTTKDNMRSLAMQGYWQHGPLLGYNKHTIFNNVGKPRPSLIPDATAPIIVKVLERFAEGDINPMQLHKFALELGLKTKPYTRKDGTRVPPKAIGKNGMYMILKRPEYAGYVHDSFTNYELVEGQHDSLISKELFEHNQKLLNKKEKVKDSYSKHNPIYPLKEVLLCLGCRKPLYGSAPRNGGGKHNPRYHCYRQGCEGIKKRSMDIIKTHELWMDMLKDVQPTEGFLRAYKEILIRQAAKENGRVNEKVKAQRIVLDDLAETRLNAIEDRLMEKDPKRKNELSELLERLDVRKSDAKENLIDLEMSQTVQESKIAYAVNYMHDIAKQWLDADYDLRVRFQTLLFPRGLTYDMETMQFGTDKLSPLYRYAANKKDLSDDEKSLLVIPRRIELRLPG
ncbi:MAG: site-specific recombinase [Candidatus Saccharibacteria bacterium]|nr:site-specific recombinase [Candidatus Saccharibacteria bacterium]